MSDTAFDAVMVGLIILAIVLSVLASADWIKAGRGRRQRLADQQRREVEHE
jgi:hypothetical protein